MKDILFNALLVVLIPAIGGGLVYGVKFGWSYLKIKLSNSKLSAVTYWIEKLVAAAEQTLTDSTAKKSYVTTAINNILSTLKITCFSDTQIDALIEAAVQQLNTVTDTVVDTITDTSTEATESATEATETAAENTATAETTTEAATASTEGTTTDVTANTVESITTTVVNSIITALQQSIVTK